MRKISVFLCLYVFVFAQPSIDELLGDHLDKIEQENQQQTQEEAPQEELDLSQIENEKVDQKTQEQGSESIELESEILGEIHQEAQEEQKIKEFLGSDSFVQDNPQISEMQENKEIQVPQEINKPKSSADNPINSDFFNKNDRSEEKLQAINPQYLRDKITQCEEREDQNACFEVGMLFYQGRSVYGQKLQQALYFFDRSCDTKRGLGCYEAGIIAANSQAYQHAFIFLEKSCQSGDLRGCKNLGVLYYNGWGTPKNIYKATEIFNLGCKKGDRLSCQKLYLALGNAYQESLNYSGAKKNYRQACELGESQACQKLEAVIMLENNNRRQNFR
ncbi:cysteine-rich protein H [Helicobacter pametensis]|nr:cysteine-rich protein H [Helicobacter pametensis]